MNRYDGTSANRAPDACRAAASVAANAAARDLAAPLQALDRAAWTALYLDQRRLVRGVLASHVGYGPDLEDLTQQVFTTAATLVQEGKVTLRGEVSGLRAWLAAIAHRIGLAARRRWRDAPREPSADGEGAQPEVDPEARQVLRRARAAWQQLPEKLQAPWLLRRLEHMTIDEIAQSLSISPATTKRRIAEADKRFDALASHDPVLCEYLRSGEGP
jgi:RNA polymerase sigma factor (sigma-70 family)